ncbi:nitrate/nitrite sensor protein NarQ [mine drainage metagenome]|uniref:Nitrate/nitrite sensor protein NarQ n=1 Tax=mine drainage metagenome TaxID=410659 RepID=A0A1J5RHT0_9ZZZZ
MNFRGLRTRFVLFVLVAYLVGGAAAFFALIAAARSVTADLTQRYATKQALYEKTKVLAAIRRDLALSLKLADSPLIRDWIENEDDPALRKLAFAELESYRRLFQDKSYFLIVDKSLHYYYDDAKGEYASNPLRYTLNQKTPGDAWYFKIRKSPETLELKADYDHALNVTKVWFNVAILDNQGRKIGLGGSGVDISKFLKPIVESREPGVQTLLFDRAGVIQAARDQRIVEHNSNPNLRGKPITVFDTLTNPASRVKLRACIDQLSTSGEAFATTVISEHGRRYYAALAYLPEIHWYNLVLVDEASVISSSVFLPVVGVAVLTLLGIILAIGFYLNRSVIRPLGDLSRSAEQVAGGDYSVQLESSRADEIGVVNRSFSTMARTVKDHTENLERKVAERTEQLRESMRAVEEANGLIMDSLRYAKMIQDAVLPKAAEVARLVPNHAVIYRPRDLVGGDFWFYHEEGDSCLIGVADCTGHGVPGALMTMTANSVFSQLVSLHGIADPAKLLGELDRQLRKVLHQGDAGRTEVDNGLEAALCSIRRGAPTLTFASSRISLFRSRGGDVEEIRGDRQGLGYAKNDPDYVYHNRIVPIGTGSTFHLTTDGWLDQAGGPKGLCFGLGRFVSLLKETSGLPLDEQRRRLEAALAAYQGEQSQRDDITLLTFRLQ